jgi:hypothetical protein
MILVIDTSAAMSGIALLDGDSVHSELVMPSGRDFDVATHLAALAPDLSRLSAVMVGLGPGSFTGLRQGIAFGVGLAISLAIPLLGIGSLELTAARSLVPALAVTEAGRGRVYYLAPDGSRGVAAVMDLPSGWPLVGWLRVPVADPGMAADLRSFGEAALVARPAARPVAYGTVKADYMQEFGRLD